MSIELGSYVIGGREVVIGLIALVAIYISAVLWRMRRLPDDRHAASAAAGGPARREPEPVPPPAAPSAPAAGDPGWAAAQSQLAQAAFMRGVEDELAQLREEVDALRGEVAALRDEMRQEVGHMRASHPVSPIYSDAMQMAQLGHDALTIAERCGIARAEAELVVALVKSQNQ